MLIDCNGFKINTDKMLIESCPKGEIPKTSVYKKSEKTIISYFDKNNCINCSMKTTKTCNGKFKNNNYMIKIKEKAINFNGCDTQSNTEINENFNEARDSLTTNKYNSSLYNYVYIMDEHLKRIIITSPQINRQDDELQELIRNADEANDEIKKIELLLKIAEHNYNMSNYYNAYRNYSIAKSIINTLDYDTISDDEYVTFDNIYFGFMHSELKLNEFNDNYNGLDMSCKQFLKTTVSEAYEDENVAFKTLNSVFLALYNDYKYNEETAINAETVMELINAYGEGLNPFETRKPMSSHTLYEDFDKIIRRLFRTQNMKIRDRMFNMLIDLCNLCLRCRDFIGLANTFDILTWFIISYGYFKIELWEEYLAKYYERLSYYIYAIERNVDATFDVQTIALMKYKELYNNEKLQDLQTFSLLLLNNGYFNFKKKKNIEEAFNSYILGLKLAADLNNNKEIRTDYNLFRDVIKQFYNEVWPAFKNEMLVTTNDFILISTLIDSFNEVFTRKEDKEFYEKVKSEIKYIDISNFNNRENFKETMAYLISEVEKIKRDSAANNIDNIKSGKLLNDVISDMQIFKQETNDRLSIVETEIKDIKSILHNSLGKIAELQETIGQLSEFVVNDFDKLENFYKSLFNKFILTLEEVVRSSYTAANEHLDIIVSSISSDCWERLNEDSKKMLVTSLVVYNNIAAYNNQLDYSSVCITAVKALEIELCRRFFIGYKEFLNRIKGDYDSWPSSMIDKKTKMPLNDDDFTLGKLAYITGYYKQKNIKNEEYSYNISSFKEYLNSELIENNNEFDVDNYIKKLNEDVIKVKDNFRNPAAHKDLLNRTEAKRCLDFLIFVYHLMELIIEPCRY